MSTATACPLCGDASRMKKAKLLYGQRVCRKCVNGFANRRQFAFCVDWLAIYAINLGATFACLFYFADELGQLPLGAQLPLTLGFLGLLLVKDGFSGCSPGKKLMGVQAINRATLAPIGFKASVLRNMPVFIPFGVLIVAFDLMDGPRIGDGWSKSKVIWTRYADHPIFTGKPLPAAVGFGPEHVDLPPVVESSNPFQPPRA